MKSIVRALVIALIVTAGGAALAGEKAGVTMPDTMQVAGKTLVLNGMGLREATMLKLDVYVAGLYLEKVSSDPAKILSSGQTMRLVMQFKRDVDRGKIVGAWNDGYENNHTVALAKIRSQIEQLNGWMTDMREGDLLTFTYLPGQGLQVHKGSKLLGTIPGDDFARSTFAIWLGKDPPSKALKKGLLGNH
jgi:hypothetical protein